MVYSTPKKRVLFVRRFIPVLIALCGVFSLLLLNLGSPKLAYATASDTVNFQARLQSSSGAIVPDGTYNLEFKLYNATGSSSNPGSCTSDCVWSEQYTGANKVTVKNGYLSVQLGSQTAFPANLDWSQQLYLTMDIGGTSSPSWDGEMLPRLALTATPYSFLSKRATTADNADQISTSNANGTNTLSLQGPSAGNGGQSFVLQDQGASGTYYVLASNTSGDVSVSGTVTAAHIDTSSVDTASAGTLTVGGTNATAISLGNTSTNIATTINGTATVKPTAGHDSSTAFRVQNANADNILDVDTTSGAVVVGNATNGGQLTNYGSTLNTAKALSNFGSGGSIGSAASTVDTQTSFTVNQTTAGQTLTLPSPTDTTAGRIIYIANIGSASFNIGTTVIGAGMNASFLWNGSSWTATAVSTGVTIVGGFSGSSQANGASISGNTITFGPADASNPGMVTTGSQSFAGAKTFSSLITGSAGATISGGAVSLAGNNNSSFTTSSGTLTLQGAGTTTLNTANVAGAATGNLTLGTGNVTSGSFASGNIGIDVGTSTGTTGTIAIGTANASGVSIGNTGGSLTLDGSNSGTIAVGNSAGAHTINIGSGSGANNTTVAIGSGVTGGSNTASVTIGSANAAASTTTIQGGNGSGAVSIQAAASGTVSIATSNNNNVTIGTAAVAGTTTIGGTNTTGTITLGQSTATNEIDIGNAVTGSGNTQTIKIGTGASGTGSASITVGSTSSGSQVKLQGGSAYLNLSNTAGVAVQGSGSTNATTALGVTNSSSSILGQFLDDGTVNLGGGTGASYTFGLTTQGSTQANNYYQSGSAPSPVELLSSQRITTDSRGGTVTSLSTYIGGIHAGDKGQMGIYTDASCSGTPCPGTYLASTAATNLTASSWNTWSVNANLSPLTSYWLVYWTNDTTADFNDAQTYNTSGVSGQYWNTSQSTWQGGSSNGMPTSMPAGTTFTSQFQFAVYATLINTKIPISINGGNGSTAMRNTTDSTTAFQVQNAAGSSLLTVNTSGSGVNIGATGSSTLSSTIHVADTSDGTGTQTVTIGGTANASNTVTLQAGSASAVLTNNGGLSVQGSTSGSGTDALTVTNSSSVTLAQVQDDGQISLGQTSTGTLGYTSAGGVTSGWNGLMSAQQITTGGATTITSISVYIPNAVDASPNDQYQVAIYANSSGSPGAYIASSTPATLTVGWNTASVSASLSAGTSYWLVYWSNDSNSGYVSDEGLTGGSYTQNLCLASGQTFGGGSSNGMPATFPSCNAYMSNGFVASIYANAGSSAAATISPAGAFAAYGSSSFKNYINSTTGFLIQNSSNVSLFTADTTNSRIVIGSGSVGEASAVLLVLDNKNTSSDPTGVNGAMYYNAVVNSFRCYENGVWRACLGGLANSSTAASSAISNTAAKTNFSGGTNNSYGVLANDCQTGVTYTITASGVYSTTGAPTLQLYLNEDGTGTTLLNTSAITTPSNASNLGWQLTAQMVCTSTTTVEVQGSVSIGNATTSLATSAIVALMQNASTLTWDTSAHTLYVGAQWGTADASNTITMRQFIVQRTGP